MSLSLLCVPAVSEKLETNVHRLSPTPQNAHCSFWFFILTGLFSFSDFIDCFN